jgi:hypothetical protein
MLAAHVVNATEFAAGLADQQAIAEGALLASSAGLGQ